jgi:glycosyltransferase involved in cell wall biosynthesis
MRLLLDRSQNAHLHLFGDGSLKAQLQDRIRGFESNIHLGGYADPDMVIAYMRTCDWLVIPSRIESIPLIFVDALQMHLPVIATDVGDLGTLVRRFGVGKVVPPIDKVALASAMHEVLSQPREAFAEVWDTPLEIFNLRASVQRVEEALLAVSPHPS